MKTLTTVLIALSVSILLPGAASAQAANPLSAGAKAQFTGISSFVTRSADKIPEKLFSFRATPEVRTIAQLFGHIADAYFMMCSAAEGGKPPQQGLESSATTKAALVKALADGVSYCQSVMDRMTDQKGSENRSLRVRADAASEHPLLRDHAHLRALRKPGDLHAAEQDRPAIERGSAGALARSVVILIKETGFPGGATS